MNAIEAARVLSMAAAFDNRTPSEIAARAWAESLPDISEADAKAIIPGHYRDTRDWIMPSDVMRAVRALRHRRVADMKTPQPPESIHADDTARERAWVRAYVAAIGDGLAPADADERACIAVRVKRADQIQAPRPVPQIVQQTTDAMKRIPGRDAA